MNKVKHPFWVIVHREIADHVHSLRFVYGPYQYRCSNKA